MNDQVATTATFDSGQATGPGTARYGQPYLDALVSAVCAPAMSLSGRDGQIRSPGAEGLYVQDLRALSRLVLTVDGTLPVPLGHDLVGGATNEFHCVVAGAGHPGPDPTVFVHRERALNPVGMVERYTVKSYAPSTVNCRVELALVCDLAGIATVKAGLPTTALEASAADGGLVWELPGRCCVRAAGFPSPDAVDPVEGSMSWDISPAPGQAVTLSVEVCFQEQGAAPLVLAAPGRDLGCLRVPEVRASDQRLQRFVELSLADLTNLRMAEPGDPDDIFVAAGVPWYLTLFGRDSIWAARMLLPLGTDLALGTLRTLARFQGRSLDARTGEQPGKILHEVRRQITYDQPASDVTEKPALLPPVYYGTVDATPLWVCLLHDAWKWGLPENEVARLLAPMQRCLTWLAEFGCRAGGFVSYVDESGQGLANQGWKDSWDAVQFRDGRVASAPLALCEVQGYAYEAATAGAELLDAFALPAADRWREFAAALAERFRARFWVEDNEGPYPAIALTGDGTPVDSLSSNVGHLLGTGILDAHESELIARRLHGSDLNSGFGLRTLAASSSGFNPVSYHCGSVWAHDTAISVTGLARTPSPVARQAAASLVEGLLSAAEGFGYRLPELYGGHERAGRRAPLPYPASCHPQAWSAASSIGILAALLGIQPDLPASSVRLSPLATPTGLRGVDGLRLGDSPVSVQIDPGGKVWVSGAPAGVRVLD